MAKILMANRDMEEDRSGEMDIPLVGTVVTGSVGWAGAAADKEDILNRIV